MPCSCAFLARLTQEALADLPRALQGALDRRPGGESLNALARRLGARKEALSKHRDECLGLVAAGSKVEPAEAVGHPNGADHQAGRFVRTTEPVVPVETRRPSDPRATPGGPPSFADESSGPLGGPPEPPAEVQDANGRVLLALPPPGHVESRFAQRALMIADLMSRGRWNRRKQRELGVSWGVTDDAVREYAQAATVTLAADRGQLEAQRTVSVAYATSRRDACRRNAARQQTIAEEAKEIASSSQDDLARARALQAEATARKNAGEAGKLELAWHEHADKVSGTLAPAAPSTTVNVLAVAQSPTFEAFMVTVLAALEDEPAAREKVVTAVRAEIEARRAKKALAA